MLTAIAIVAALFSISACNKITYAPPTIRNEYDYIIVGAGSAGSVIASGLSEDPQVRVLLLEAGGLPDDVSEVPLFAQAMTGGEMDWAYYSEPQEKACLAMEERRSYIPRGKVLGGSSILNYMNYVRGMPRDYDEWSRDGATGWAWKDVLPYFKKSEDQRDPILSSKSHHSTGGPLAVSTVAFETPVRAAFMEAGRSLGYPVVDHNDENVFGFAYLQVTTRDGLRCSTEKAFLRPSAHRDNLDIVIHAHVTRINFDQQSKRAVSVNFEHRNNTRTVLVAKEVIVSAGAIASPQLLMLSGVGPKEHLKELGIPVVSDLPVGENLRDHVMAGGLIYLVNSSSGVSRFRDFSRETIAALLKGNGPLTVPVHSEGLAFLNTKFQEPSENWPDVGIFSMSLFSLPPVNRKVTKYLEQFEGIDAVSLFPMVTRPESRGYIRLRSTNPFDHPIIDPKMLDKEQDLMKLVEGMKIADLIMQTPSFQKFEARRLKIEGIGCDMEDIHSEEYLTCLARAITMNMYHQSGTCKMGATSDPTTVVDPQLRLKGVKGVRVADASVMPRVTSGNTNAPCIMIGQKAVDLIKSTKN